VDYKGFVWIKGNADGASNNSAHLPNNIPILKLANEQVRDGHRQERSDGGLRVGEVTRLKVADIDARRLQAVPKWGVRSLCAPAAYSSGSTLRIVPWWFAPTHRLGGFVELSTSTCRMLANRGRRYSTNSPVLVFKREA
jgi:hypothetical protein